MKAAKQGKIMIKNPDFRVSKANEEKGLKLFENFFQGVLRGLVFDAKAFSTLAMIQRVFDKKKNDPSEKHIFEVIRRMDKDKIHSEVAIQISEKARLKAANMQQLSLIKMIPFFVAVLALLVLSVLVLVTRPLAFTNPLIQRYLIISLLFVPVLVWGLKRRSEAKLDLIAINVLVQAAAAYASAKMQGKGQIGAMQNLEEMRRKAKKLEENSKTEKKKSK